MIKVIELFAGVGGFRLGLQKNKYEVIWSNQYEPLTKTVQHASEIYKSVWPDDNHSNKDIEEVIENDFKSIPDHDIDKEKGRRTLVIIFGKSNAVKTFSIFPILLYGVIIFGVMTGLFPVYSLIVLLAKPFLILALWHLKDSKTSP